MITFGVDHKGRGRNPIVIVIVMVLIITIVGKIADPAVTPWLWGKEGIRDKQGPATGLREVLCTTQYSTTVHSIMPCILRIRVSRWDAEAAAVSANCPISTTKRQGRDRGWDEGPIGASSDGGQASRLGQAFVDAWRRGHTHRDVAPCRCLPCLVPKAQHILSYDYVVPQVLCIVISFSASFTAQASVPASQPASHPISPRGADHEVLGGGGWAGSQNCPRVMEEDARWGRGHNRWRGVAVA